MQPSVRACQRGDHGYPIELLELERPPDRFVVRGVLPLVPGVAIVGTRKPSARAVAFTRELARALARAGVAVWSGGAVGIDAAAHRGALDGGGPTVVVMGTGIEQTYPPEHERLYQHVVATGGALISHLPDRQEGAPWTFLSRNGLLAALTRATLMVQAGIVSGARSTAAAARRLGRPLFVFPAWPWDPRGAGNLAEIAMGARAFTGLRPLLEAIDTRLASIATCVRPPKPRAPRKSRAAGLRPPSMGSPTPPEGPAPLFSSLRRTDPELDDACRSLLEHVSHIPVHTEFLCRRTGWPPPRLQQALLTLTLEAVLVEGPAGWFRRS